MSVRTNIRIAVLFLFSVLFFGGCDDRKIDALEEETGRYSIYGALNLHETPNYVRVKNLKQVFFSDSAKSFDGVVTFEDLQGGTSRVLEDTVVNFSGNYTHNFIVEQPLEPGKTYSLEVKNESGSSVSSMTTTPRITQVSNNFGNENYAIPCNATAEFVFENVEKPEKVEVEIGFTYNDEKHWGSLGKVRQLQHRSSADEMYVRMSPRMLLIEVFPPPGIDNPSIDPAFLNPEVQCHQLGSDQVEFRYIHYGREWESINPANGPFNPIESPDVDNGLGFFGSYRKGLYTFNVDTALAD